MAQLPLKERPLEVAVFAAAFVDAIGRVDSKEPGGRAIALSIAERRLLEFRSALDEDFANRIRGGANG